MRSGTIFLCGLIGLWIARSPLQAKAQERPMPTAFLPIEPLSDDEEFRDDGANDEAPAALSPRPLVEMAPRREPHDMAVALRVQMTQEGFGGQVRLLQYSRPWLAVSQTLRYFAPDAEPGLYAQRYGLMLGAELHPWREARLSPFATLQAGGERFNRELLGRDLDLFVGELAVGLDLQLNRLASFSLQWLGSYYGGLKQRLFDDQKRGGPTHASIEVFFTMDWETKM